jgi:prophage regulatory protein
MDIDTREAHLDRLIGWPEIQKTIGLSRPQIWRLRRDGNFPSPLKLSQNRVAWKSSEVQSWIDSRERA